MVVLYGGFVCENVCKRNLWGSNPRALASGTVPFSGSTAGVFMNHCSGVLSIGTYSACTYLRKKAWQWCKRRALKSKGWGAVGSRIPLWCVYRRASRVQRQA